MQRRLSLLIIIVMLVFSMGASAFAEAEPRMYFYQDIAKDLNSVGIVPDIYLRISEKPTAIEKNIILNNIDMNNFDDDYGLSTIPNFEQYIGKMLGILGYQVKADDDVLSKAVEFGLATQKYIDKAKADNYEFVNDDVIYLVYKALNCKVNGEDKYLIEKLMDMGKIELSEVYDNGLYRKTIDINMSGIVTYTGTGEYATFKDYSGNLWYGSVTDLNPEEKISTIEIVGDDLREYTIFLTKDQVINEKEIVGKRITFSGKRVFNYFGNGQLKSIKADTFSFSDDFTGYEMVTLKGKLLPVGNMNDFAGDDAYTFIDANGVSYTALMRQHVLIDKKPAEGEMYMGSYNLLDYTNTDIEVRALKPIGKDYFFVKEMGKEFSWNPQTKKWKSNNFGYPGNTIMFLTVQEEMAPMGDNVFLKGTFNTLYMYDDLETVVKFNKGMLGEKTPDASFVGKTITVYYPETADIYNDELILARDWFYDNANQLFASLVKFDKVLKTTDKYIEYQVSDKYNTAKTARLYKNRFSGEALNGLIGKSKYVTGDMINVELKTVWVKEMFR